jgi:hypothetical protein
MRSIISLLVLLLPAAVIAAQSAAPAPAPKLEVALAYDWVHTNAPPADCGCFHLNGGSVAFAYRLTPKWAGVAEAGAVANTNVNATHHDLGLVDFLAGGRFTYANHSRFQPFGQILVGDAHAAGGLSPSQIGVGSSDAFALATGGGLDIDLTPRLAIRAAQADYYLTLLPNRTTNTQNNLRIGAGIVFRFGRK